MPGNARKLARASFNIRFILFHGPVGSAANFSSRRGLFSRSVHKRSRYKRRDGRDRRSRGGAKSSSQFPKQGLFSTRGKLNFRSHRAHAVRIQLLNGSNVWVGIERMILSELFDIAKIIAVHIIFQ